MRKLYLFLGLVCFAACNKPEFCVLPNSTPMTMVFKAYDSTNVLIDTPLTGASVFSTDTAHLYAKNVKNLSGISVYLRPNLTTQKFVVQQNSIDDTITVQYNAQEHFISNGCGYQFYFDLKSVAHTRNSIDSVKINNAAVNGSTSTYHLEVIYK